MNLNFIPVSKEPLSHIEKLDRALFALSNHKSGFYQYGGLFTDMNTRYGASISELEMKRIIDKLHKDGFIIIEYTDRYYITFDGYIFEENGGYQSKALKDANATLLVQMEINRREAQDINLQGLSSRLNRWTLGLLIATGVLALIEIIKFICDIDPCIKEFFERLI